MIPPFVRNALNQIDWRNQVVASVYKTKDGVWHGQVAIGSYPNGGSKYRTVSARTKQEAKTKVEALVKSLNMGLDPTAQRQRTGDFLKRWLEERVKTRVRNSTFESYETHVRRHLAMGLGHIRLCDLKPQAIQTWVNGEVKKAKRSTRSIAYSFSLLKNALGVAVKWNLLERNPAIAVDLPRQTKFRSQPYDPQEATKFIAAVQEEPLRALWILAISTGLRQGECLALQWNDIDFDAGTAAVTKTLIRVKGEGLKVQDPKTEGSHRVQFLPKIALDALRERRAQCEEAKGYVFTDDFGSPLDGANVAKHFKAMLERLNLRVIRMHDLRHTAASLAIASGVELKAVSGMLGHSNIAITADTYGHLFESTKRATANALDQMLRGEKTASTNGTTNFSPDSEGKAPKVIH